MTAAALFTAPAAQTATSLTMGGTFNPLETPPQPADWVGYYIGTMNDKYVAGTGLCGAVCARVGVYTPEEIGWLSGIGTYSFNNSIAAGQVNLDACLRGVTCRATESPYTLTENTALTDSAYVVFGYSQSAAIASLEKSTLIAHPATATVDFVTLANPNRPNGGILARVPGLFIPFLGVTFNGAMATNSPQDAPLTTVDVVGQYDLISDTPNNPLNLLAMINAVAGYYFVHLRPLDIGTPELQGQYQDSTYYLIPTPTLPILTPIAMIPWIGPLVAGVLDPPLRVLVESAYNRTINPGTPTMANPFYIQNPLRTIVNFLNAIPVGWDNGLSYIADNPDFRPFGTVEPGPYGVGGPPVYTSAIEPYGPPTPATERATVAAPASVPRANAVRHKASAAGQARHSGGAKRAIGHPTRGAAR